MCSEFELFESSNLYSRASKYTCLNVSVKKKNLLQGGFQPDFYKSI